MLTLRSLVLAGLVALWMIPPSAWAADQKVMLMLGGKFCEMYPDAIQAALKKVAGVKAVDLKSMKGHAVVTGDGTMKPDQLAAAVTGVKGDGWHCKAEVMQ
ncbi:MAG: cation transporter [Nitrospirota bacterium]|nr:cation transporter [Nitrospirota bacterium]